MANILVITAADKNFEEMVKVCADSSINLGYKTQVYDLGGLGYGKPFQAKISTQVGAKIPSKPSIIKDAISQVNIGDYVVWLDADTIMWDHLAIEGFYDIGVTVRKPKTAENDLPINAGVVFVKKTNQALKFLNEWIKLCETGKSDQVELNKLSNVKSSDIDSTVIRNETRIKVFPCDLYNNFYFKKSQLHAKIIHYKSKHRYWWPKRTIKKIPKNPSPEIVESNTQTRF